MATQATELAEVEGRLKKLKNKLGKNKKANKSINADIQRTQGELDYLNANHAAQRDDLTAGGPDTSDGAEPESTPAPVQAPLSGAADDATAATAAAVAGPQEPRVSKAQKRREKKELETKERDARIAAAEVADDDTRKFQEYAAINAQLEPLNLKTVPIKPDGHCLFRAVVAQLDPGDGATADTLRKSASGFIRAHRDDFLPFLTTDSGDSLDEAGFEAYCTKMEGTAAYGGETELTALSKFLGKAIQVFQAAGPPRVIEVEGSTDSCCDALRLSFHRHEYSLGAHYNAVVPI